MSGETGIFLYNGINVITPPGSVISYAGTSSPNGWLLCDGTSYNKTSYTELFSIIGYSFGGSGSTFNVPDLRSKFIYGNSSTSLVTSTGGSSSITLSTANLPSHNHGLTVSGTAAASTTGVTDTGHTHGGLLVVSDDHPAPNDNGYPRPITWSYSADKRTASASASLSDPGHSHSISITGSISNTGSGTAFSILPPYVSLNYIIKI